MIASGSQNQLQSSLAPLSDLLKALMFLSNLNGFNSSPSPPIHGSNQRKGSSKVWKKKDSKWFYHFLLSSCFCLLHYLCVLLLFWVSLVLCFALFNMFLFVYFAVLVYFVFNIKIKKNEKSEKYKNSVCFVYISTCVPWMAIETKFSKLCIVWSLDEHPYAQLSKWALWLLFVMSKIELSLILKHSYHSFLQEGLKNPERKALLTISPLVPTNHVWHMYASA